CAIGRAPCRCADGGLSPADANLHIPVAVLDYAEGRFPDCPLGIGGRRRPCCGALAYPNKVAVRQCVAHELRRNSRPRGIVCVRRSTGGGARDSKSVPAAAQFPRGVNIRAEGIGKEALVLLARPG